MASLYSQASALFAVHDGPSASKPKLFQRDRIVADPDAAESDVIPDLKRYLRKEALVSSALAYKWLGVDAGENGKGAKVGEALAWVMEARGRLAQLEDGKVEAKMKGLSIGRGAERRKEARKARQGRIEREIADADAWVSSYKKMNDTVSFGRRDIKLIAGRVPARTPDYESRCPARKADLCGESVLATRRQALPAVPQ